MKSSVGGIAILKNMIKRNYEAEILINGRPVKEYFHNHRTYIEGREGSIFSIRLRNNSSEKASFVTTVDGLSVIDGKDGSYNSRGYILDANSTMKIDGWRMNDNEVAEFYFSSVGDSYRKRKGEGNNVGSIAVAVFREKEKIDLFPLIDDRGKIPYVPYIPHEPLPIKPREPWTPHNPWEKTYGKDTAHTNKVNDTFTLENAVPTSSSMCALLTKERSSQDVGTGFGQTKHSEVIIVEFDRESNPDAVLELFYNSRKQLSRIGVDINRQRYSISEPNSFPNENGYCKRPRN